MFSFLSRLYLRTLDRWIPTDHFSRRYAVSVKGICLIDDQVVLVRTDQHGWDLPGGKLGRQETLETTLRREFAEELGIKVEVNLLQAATRRKIGKLLPSSVVILLYYCRTDATREDLRLSPEHTSFGLFSLPDLLQLNLPQAYHTAIQDCINQHSDSG